MQAQQVAQHVLAGGDNKGCRRFLGLTALPITSCKTTLPVNRRCCSCWKHFTRPYLQLQLENCPPTGQARWPVPTHPRPLTMKSLQAWRSPRKSALRMLAQLHLPGELPSLVQNAVQDASDREYTTDDCTGGGEEVVPVPSFLTHHHLQA